MAVQYTNNATSLLTASISSAGTSLSVTAGTGALFPALSSGDYFYATIVDNAGNNEIVKVTARSTDTFTIVRGQDGTTARAFSVGDKVELRIVRALLDSIRAYQASSASYGTLLGRTDTGIYSAPQTFEYTGGVYSDGQTTYPGTVSTSVNSSGDTVLFGNGYHSSGVYAITELIRTNQLQVGQNLKIVVEVPTAGNDEVGSGVFNLIDMGTITALSWNEEYFVRYFYITVTNPSGFNGTGATWRTPYHIYGYFIYNFVLGGTSAENVLLGNSAGAGVTTGGKNVILGANAGNNVGSGLNNVVIGNAASASAQNVSNEVTLGNSYHTKTRLFGALAMGGSSVGTTGQVLVSQGAGAAPIWSTVSSNSVLPSQTGNAGKFLTTDGSSVSWGTVDLTPYLTTSSAASTYQTQSGMSSYLTTSSAASTYLTQTNAASTYQPLDGDLTSIAGLTGTSGLLKKTAANTWALDTSTYLTGNQSITVSGDASGSGATAITLTLANSGVTAGTYTKVTVDAKGRVTAGASLASADLPTYTGTLTSSQVTTALGYTPYNSTNPNGYTNNTGTVTSVALSLPALFSVSGSPVTTSGTLTASLATQTANTVFAGPTTGVAAAPTFRALVSADLPTYTGTLTSSQVTTALGFTPYNSTNPNGYITGITSSMVTTALGFTPISSSGTTTGQAGGLTSSDTRTISPSSHGSGRLTFGFTSWANNGGSPYADYLHLRSYTDSSGGTDNLVMFSKSGIGMRIWQQSWGSATAYSSYVDVLHSGNYSNYALPLSGGTISGNLGLGVAPDLRLSLNGDAQISGYLYMGGTAGSYNSWGSRDYTSSGVRYFNASSYQWNNYGYGSTYTLALDATSLRYNGNTVLHTGNPQASTEWYHSGRDFVNGTLITTSIDYSQVSGDPFILEIRGNSYGSGIPFDIQLQGYIYSSTIINYGAYSTGPNFNIIAMNVGGALCFWFARQAYWQGFNVRCYTAYGTRAVNKVVSITDVANPGGSKQVTYTPVQVLRSDNYSSYSPSLTGSGASGTWGISITGNAGSAGGFTHNAYNTQNMRIYANTTGAVGILGVDSAGTFRYQLYGDGSNYGFLNGAWAGWDLRKSVNSQLYLTVGGTEYTAVHSGNITSYAPGSVSGARAWVNFNGTGTTGANQTINSSYNVTSVYKNAGADWTINYTAAIGNNHALVVTSRIGGGGNGSGSGGAIPQIYGLNGAANPLTTTSARFSCYNTLTGASAGDIICAVAFSQ